MVRPVQGHRPMLDDIAGEYKGKVRIAKLNVDENPRTAQRFNVRSIPTLILFKSGQVQGQKVGAPRKPDLVAFLDSKL
jgi:thioredoxin 1